MRHRILSIAILVLLLAAIGAVAFTVIRPAKQGFTEFYLLDAEGGVMDYPEEVYAGDTVSVTLGITSHEATTSSYRITISIGGEKDSLVSALSLEPEEKWQETVSFVPERATSEEKVEFLLYKNGQTEPYCKTHLWLNIKSRTP
jgi:uncharacterized membrane protein